MPRPRKDGKKHTRNPNESWTLGYKVTTRGTKGKITGGESGNGTSQYDPDSIIRTFKPADFWK